MDALAIDVLTMDDLPTPGAPPTSTLFLLQGEPIHLDHFWQLTKQLEILPLVSSWEQITVEIEPHDYCSVLAVVLAVPAEQWNFVQEIEMNKGEE